MTINYQDAIIRTMSINELEALNALARAEAKRFPIHREALVALRKTQGRCFDGIVGPRGVGKTVILKQLALETDQSFYGSVDTFKDVPLFELAQVLFEKRGIRTLLLDEIHFLPGFDGELKKIFDFLPDLHVVFTSSVALALQQSAFDLSRRVRLVKLLPFSFREYVRFKEGVALDRLVLDAVGRGDWTFDHARYGYLFDAYLKGGLYPFALTEPDPLAVLRSILDTVLQRDIPSVAKVTYQDVALIGKVLTFIGRSAVDGVNPTTIARNMGITRYKAIEYVDLLSKAFILIQVEPKGTNVLREPKILMQIPYRLLYRSWDDAIGAVREDFFATAMNIASIPFHYLKSTTGRKTPDFWLATKSGDWVVEIGGPGKGRTQFKGVTVKRKMVLAHDADARRGAMPLFMAGYLA